MFTFAIAWLLVGLVELFLSLRVLKQTCKILREQPLLAKEAYDLMSIEGMNQEDFIKAFETYTHNGSTILGSAWRIFSWPLQTITRVALNAFVKHAKQQAGS